MNRLISTICLVFLLLAAQTGFAQNKPTKADPKKTAEAPKVVKDEEVVDIPLTFDSTSIPDDELSKAILELLDVSGALKVGAQMAKNVSDMQKNDASGKLPAEFYDRLLKEFDKGQCSKWMINSIARVYREHFTLEEAKQITAFYKTPVGQKVIVALPQITQLCFEEGQKIGQYTGMKIYYELVKEGKIKE